MVKELTIMVILDLFKNYKLKFKEKLNNSSTKQLLRMVKNFVSSPIKSIRNGILKVMIGVTYECQCDCEYCCSGLYKKNKENELDIREFKKLINDIDKLPFPVILISFFGGEPLIRNDIFDLIEYTAKKGLFTEIETNGLLLSLQNVKRLKKTGLHHLFVRIEYSNPESHDRVSNFKGCFEKAIQGIKYCVKEKLSCSISIIATKEKIYNGEINKVINLGRELKVTSVRILYPTLAGKWLNADEELLTEQEKEKVKNLLKPDFIYLESSYVYKKSERICPSKQKKMFYISCYGEVQPCPFVPLTFGSIRNENLKKILKKMWNHPFLQTTDYRGCLMNDSTFRNTYINQINSEKLVFY